METLLAESPLHTTSPFASFQLTPDIKCKDSMYASKSSSETDIHSELIQVRKQNSLLWKLVEKQRTVISQLKLHLKQASINAEIPTSREVQEVQETNAFIPTSSPMENREEVQESNVSRIQMSSSDIFASALSNSPDTFQNPKNIVQFDIDEGQDVSINDLEDYLPVTTLSRSSEDSDSGTKSTSPSGITETAASAPSSKAASPISTDVKVSATLEKSDFLIPELYSHPISESPLLLSSIPEKYRSSPLPAPPSTTSLLLVTPPKFTSSVFVPEKIKEFNHLPENPSLTEMVFKKPISKSLPSPPLPISFPSLPESNSTLSLRDTDDSTSSTPNTSQMLVPELLVAISQGATSSTTKITRNIRSKPLPNISINTLETLKPIPYPSPEKKAKESNASSTDELSLEFSETSPVTPPKTTQFTLETTSSAVEGLPTLAMNNDTEKSDLDDLFMQFSEPSPIVMSPKLTSSPSKAETKEVKPLRKTVVPTRGNSLYFVHTSPTRPLSTPMALKDVEQEREGSPSDLSEKHLKNEKESPSSSELKIVEAVTEVSAVKNKEVRSSLHLAEKTSLPPPRNRPTSMSVSRNTSSLPNRNSSLPAPLASSPNALTIVNNKSSSSSPTLPSSLPSLPSIPSPTSSFLKNPPARKHPAVAPKQPFEMAPLKAPPEEKSTGIVRFFPEVFLHPPAPFFEDEQRMTPRIASSHNATRDSLYLNQLPPRRQSYVHNVDEALFTELMQTDREKLQAKLSKMTPEEVAKIHSLLKDRTSK